MTTDVSRGFTGLLHYAQMLICKHDHLDWKSVDIVSTEVDRRTLLGIADDGWRSNIAGRGAACTLFER